MRKLMWFSVGFTLAAFVGMYFLTAMWYFAAAGVAALLLAVFLCLHQRFDNLRIGVAVALGCVIGFTWISLFDALYLSTVRAADGETLKMTLVATDYAQETDYGKAVDGVGFLNGKPYQLRIYLSKDAQAAPGDRLTGAFRLRATLPGASGESSYYTADHLFLTATAAAEPTVDHAQKLPWYGYPAYARKTIRATLCDAFPDDTAGFAVALLIGDKQQLDYEIDTAFKLSGISHIIAVSGLHVTILFSLIYVLVGRKNWVALVVGLPILFFFAAVAGFSPSIMRACIMHSLMIVSLLLRKEYDPPTALGFAVLLMLLIDPWTITSVSFQLSVACMIGIFLFAEPIRDRLMDKKYLGRFKGRARKFCNTIAASIGMSVGATVTVTPLCAYYFHTVSLVSVLTNLLTVWLVTFVFYGVLIVLLTGLLWAPLGAFFGLIVAWPIRYILAVSKLLASFPLAAVFTDSVYIVLWLIFAYGLLVLYLLRRKNVLGSICCCAIALCLALAASWTEPLLDECRVTVLDVGQGQCIVLQSEGKTYVVDCGGDSDTGAANTAANHLMSRGIFRIDGLILTHYDRDHAAGAAYFLSRIPTRTLYLPNCADKDATAQTLPDSYTRHIISETSVLSYGDTTLSLIPSQNNLSDNESGLCVLFQTKKCDILITGDRSTAGEWELMHSVQLPKLDVLIVGHHGSKYSTDPLLLDVTRPRIAIISVGADNPYGHPTEEVLDRLADYGCAIFRTDVNGTVIFRG